MKIGIIGAGRMAGALGVRFARAGHQIRIGARRAEAAATLAAKIGLEAEHGGITEAARASEIILLAVKRVGIPDALAAAGPLEGKALIDCNNLGPDPEEGPTIAETIQRQCAAHVVKAFNCCHFQVWDMTPPVFDGRPLAVPYCGDDETSKRKVRQLIEELGCRPIDIGGLSKSRHLEYLAAIIIGLLFRGEPPTTVFNLVDAASS